MTAGVEEMLIEALARNMTHVEAASEVGVSSKAVQRLLGNVDFVGRLAQRRAMKVVDYTARLDALEALALETMAEAMASERVSDRLRAVECWSKQRSYVWQALDVEARFLALEAGLAPIDDVADGDPVDEEGQS